jgi:hypothetical protein
MARNTTRVSWTGDRARVAVRTASKEAISDVCEYLLQETNKIAPLDEGVLTRSGNTDITEGAKGVEGTVYYDTPYAARLHEHPEYNFQNGREGKYLEKVVTTEATTVRDYLRRRLSERLG